MTVTINIQPNETKDVKNESFSVAILLCDHEETEGLRQAFVETGVAVDADYNGPGIKVYTSDRNLTDEQVLTFEQKLASLLEHKFKVSPQQVRRVEEEDGTPPPMAESKETAEIASPPPKKVKDSTSIVKKLIIEIFDTENSFMSSLQLLVDSLTTDKDPTLPLALKVKIEVFLAPYRQLLQFHTNFLLEKDINTDLTSCLLASVDWLNGRCAEEIVSTFILIIREYPAFSAFIKSITEDSQGKHIPTVKRLLKQQGENGEVTLKLKAINSSLSNSIVTPIQRFPRYVLLVKELLKNIQDLPNLSELDSLKANVNALVDAVSKQCMVVNEAMKVAKVLPENVDPARKHFIGLLSQKAKEIEKRTGANSEKNQRKLNLLQGYITSLEGSNDVTSLVSIVNKLFADTEVAKPIKMSRNLENSYRTELRAYWLRMASAFEQHEVYHLSEDKIKVIAKCLSDYLKQEASRLESRFDIDPQNSGGDESILLTRKRSLGNYITQLSTVKSTASLVIVMRTLFLDRQVTDPSGKTARFRTTNNFVIGLKKEWDAIYREFKFKLLNIEATPEYDLQNLRDPVVYKLLKAQEILSERRMHSTKGVQDEKSENYQVEIEVITDCIKALYKLKPPFFESMSAAIAQCLEEFKKNTSLKYFASQLLKEVAKRDRQASSVQPSIISIDPTSQAFAVEESDEEEILENKLEKKEAQQNNWYLPVTYNLGSPDLVDPAEDSALPLLVQQGDLSDEKSIKETPVELSKIETEILKKLKLAPSLHQERDNSSTPSEEEEEEGEEIEGEDEAPLSEQKKPTNFLKNAFNETFFPQATQEIEPLYLRNRVWKLEMMLNPAKWVEFILAIFIECLKPSKDSKVWRVFSFLPLIILGTLRTLVRNIASSLFPIGVALILGFAVFANSLDFGIAAPRGFLMGGVLNNPIVVFTLALLGVALVSHLLMHGLKLSVIDIPTCKGISTAKAAKEMVELYSQAAENNQDPEILHNLSKALLVHVQNARAFLSNEWEGGVLTYGPDVSNRTKDRAFLKQVQNNLDLNEFFPDPSVLNLSELSAIFDRIQKATVNPNYRPPPSKKEIAGWSFLAVASLASCVFILSLILTAGGTLGSLFGMLGRTWSLAALILSGLVSWLSIAHLLNKTSGGSYSKVAIFFIGNAIILAVLGSLTLWGGGLFSLLGSTFKLPGLWLMIGSVVSTLSAIGFGVLARRKMRKGAGQDGKILVRLVQLSLIAVSLFAMIVSLTMMFGSNAFTFLFGGPSSLSLAAFFKQIVYENVQSLSIAIPWVSAFPLIIFIIASFVLLSFIKIFLQTAPSNNAEIKWPRLKKFFKVAGSVSLNFFIASALIVSLIIEPSLFFGGDAAKTSMLFIFLAQMFITAISPLVSNFLENKLRSHGRHSLSGKPDWMIELGLSAIFGMVTVSVFGGYSFLSKKLGISSVGNDVLLIMAACSFGVLLLLRGLTLCHRYLEPMKVEPVIGRVAAEISVARTPVSESNLTLALSSPQQELSDTMPNPQSPTFFPVKRPYFRLEGDNIVVDTPLSTCQDSPSSPRFIFPNSSGSPAALSGSALIVSGILNPASQKGEIKEDLYPNPLKFKES